MSTIPVRKLAEADDACLTRPLLSPAAKMQLVILALLFGSLFWETLYRIVLFASDDPDWSHAFIIPVIALYYIYIQADRLKKELSQPSEVTKSDRYGFLAISVVFFMFFSLAVGRFGAKYLGSNPMLEGWLWPLACGAMGVIYYLVLPLKKTKPENYVLCLTVGLVSSLVGVLLAGQIGWFAGGFGVLAVGRLLWVPLDNYAARWAGLLIMVLGITAYFLGINPIRNDMVKGYAMVLALSGLVLQMTGWPAFRVLWFPVAYLLFAVKVAPKLWDALANRLQDVAASYATIAINIFGLPLGIEADVSGNSITIWKDAVKIEPALNVAEACSGLRMLMAFIALGVAVAFLANRPWWGKLILVGLTIPIAILVNIGRVTVLGLINPYNSSLTQGDFHILIGMIMLIPALGLFMLIGWILDQLIIKDSGEADKASEVSHA